MVKRIKRIFKSDSYDSIYRDIQSIDGEINNFRRHLLQDYLGLILKDDWQTTLYNIVLVEKGLSHKDNYLKIYDDMQEKGVENYSVSNMDVWQMHTLLRHQSSLFKPTPSWETLNEIEFIYKDRNEFAHGADCKNPDDLIHECKRELRNLKSLVSKVDYYDSDIQDSDRLRFRNNNSKEIKSLDSKIDLIEDEYNMRLEVTASIETILSSDNPSEEWPEYLKYYEIKSKKIQPNLDIQKTFIIRSSDANISDAHFLAAIIFGAEKKYEEMCTRLLDFVSSANVLDKQIVDQIIDMLNESRLSQHTLDYKTERIINHIKEKGIDIVQTKDGYARVSTINKSGSETKDDIGGLSGSNDGTTVNQFISKNVGTTADAVGKKSIEELEKELKDIKSKMLRLSSTNALNVVYMSMGLPPMLGLTSNIEYGNLLRRQREIKQELAKRRLNK